MCRLNCRLSVLRRSFKREIVGRNFSAEIRAIRAVWEAASLRNIETTENDHLAFIDQLQAIKSTLSSRT